MTLAPFAPPAALALVAALFSLLAAANQRWTQAIDAGTASAAAPKLVLLTAYLGFGLRIGLAAYVAATTGWAQAAGLLAASFGPGLLIRPLLPVHVALWACGTLAMYPTGLWLARCTVASVP